MGERGAPRLIASNDLRAYLGDITPATLKRWIAAGIIPGPIAGTTRWDLHAVDAALNRRSSLPTLTAANEAGDDPLQADRLELDRMFGIGGADENDRPTPGRAA